MESLKVAPLPTMPVWITRGVYRRGFFGDGKWVRENERTPLDVLMGVKKRPPIHYLSNPDRWMLPYDGGFGRKDRKLVVKLKVVWSVGEESGDYPYIHDEECRDYHHFTTDIEIFPLTPQQAAFVGAKHLTSNTTSLFWGTEDDVVELIQLKDRVGII